MERALDQNLLRSALGESQNLPSPEELAELLAQAELGLLLNDPKKSEELLEVGWYLHAIASSKYAQQTYGNERQRSAFQVSASIFDILLRSEESESERLKLCFASQIAYLRSAFDPNSISLYKREFAGKFNTDINLLEEPSKLSLICGVALLGLDTYFIEKLTKNIRNQSFLHEKNWGIKSIGWTPFGSAAFVSLGARLLTHYLLYGRNENLQEAIRLFSSAVKDEFLLSDDISRWVAAHLLNISSQLRDSSVWSSLPPEVPPEIRNAFIFGKPRILSLWPPQIDLLKPDAQGLTVLSNDVKRVLITTPTSAGKTLFTQLIVASHILTQKTSVCYVAPTISLCSEVSEALESRIKLLNFETASTQSNEIGIEALLNLDEPTIDVMTPERLSYLLRNNSTGLFAKFGLFVFDEVHLLGEKGRGWNLEESLSYIHHRTLDTNHRICLVSAVIGNKVHIRNWISRGQQEDQLAFHKEIDWRGPRRINAIWTTEIDWDATLIEGRASRDFPYKEISPHYGVLHIRISHNNRTMSLRTREPIGNLVRKVSRDASTKETLTNESTPFYKRLVPIIDHLANFGPILIIESTRSGTLRIAKALVEKREKINPADIQSLLDLVDTRLGAEHPLRNVLEYGVAYHHGSLPREIRQAIEDGIRTERLKVLVATTTLTEGVNLPVQSVVVASQGVQTQEGYVEFISGAKLINAVGRAGRATKETEGIVVLARNAQFNRTDFERLHPNEEELKIISAIATREALEALHEFEILLNQTEDAILETQNEQINSFLSYVWFLASEIEKANQIPSIEEIQNILSNTLGWTQLDQDQKGRWLNVANACLSYYERTEPGSRIRWSTTRTSLNSSVVLESVSKAIANEIAQLDKPLNEIEYIRLILDEGRLAQLLSIPEAPKTRIYSSRGGKRSEILIDFESLLYDWLEGKELFEISERHLDEVRDIEFRFEQLGDFVSSYFENFFPWIFDTIIKWTNSYLDIKDLSKQIPEAIPSFLKWGVDNPVAAELMTKGILSRRLAKSISTIWEANHPADDLYKWIRSMTIAEWKETFAASISELRNLISFSRSRKGGIVAELLGNRSVSFEVQTKTKNLEEVEVYLQPSLKWDEYFIDIFTREEAVGQIFARDYYDLSALLEMGLDLTLTLKVKQGVGLLKIDLSIPD